MRKPVLTNALGVEGISLCPGRDAEVVNSLDDFAEAAQRLLIDSNRRSALAGNGCAFVKEEYSWRKLAGRFEALYRQSLSESRSSGMKQACAT
jgi:glycosyltransferase involved in cell wall biosynthesis